ncbi:MAG: Alpha-L-fucosidase [Paenibacillaceae bacterium]|jgi:alpha-L-fucosidase|nr:Alpha-L-fucosidase [Paenibacillaceae bacterium]
MKQECKPSKQQMKWQDMEMGMFCHFGLNTYYDQEWGTGDESPARFNPVELDAGQWVRTAKEAGFQYFILTAKHHDGFCLWQTETTEHSVKNSPWKGGKGDVVAECAAACQREGVAFGIYLSPWDRHEPCYSDKEAYDRFYIRQWTELLTRYGPVAEVWLDGAGSEGREYDWPGIMDVFHKYQPDAMIFNMGRPTIRWVGNELGIAPYPCWNSATEARVSMFTKDMLTWLPDTPLWVPAECDVPLHKKHWFWHPEDSATLRTQEELMEIYCCSVGRGANLLLNVAADHRGLFTDEDVAQVREFGAAVRRKFANPLAHTEGRGEELILELPAVSQIRHVVLMEDIAQGGERIREYALDIRENGAWTEAASGSAVGHKKLDMLQSAAADGVRLRVLRADNTPLIRAMTVY